MRRYIGFLVFFTVLLPSGVLAGETSYEKHIAWGVAAMEQKQYQAAAEEFRASLTERPEDRTAALYLATALCRAGDPGAVVMLQKVLEMDHHDGRANLEMGICYFSRADYPAAKEYFGYVLQLAPGSELAAKAGTYLNALNSGVTRPWSAALQTGVQYDSNVVLSTIDGLLPAGISRKADWRLVFNLKTRYRFIRDERGEAWVGYSAYQSLHNRLQKFNLFQQQLEAGAGYRLSPLLTLGASYVYEYDLVGGDDFGAAHRISPSLTINEGQGLSTVLSYGYRRDHYMNSDLFSENHDRSGSANSFGLDQNIRISDALQLRAGYQHVSEKTKKDYWDYRGNQASLDIRVTLPQKTGLAAGAAYEKRDYQGGYPLTALTRQDKTATVSLTATKVLTDQLSVSLGQICVRNKSNIRDFDYKRAVSSLFLNVRF